MRRTRQRPTYSLEEAKALVRDGRSSLTRRVRSHLQNEGWTDIGEVATGVFESMEDSDFYKSDEIDFMPGTYADIYRGTPFDGDEWYVKFYIEQGVARVQVLSLTEDGTLH